MKKTIQILYGLSVIGVVFFFIYVCNTFQDDVFQSREDTGYHCLTSYDREDIQDENTPVGVKSEYVIHNLEIPEGGRSLVFYTIHQNAEVYIGDELVYRLQPAESNPFGKTPGNVWNTIPIYEKDAGQEIKIVLIPVYSSSVDIVPDFYFGDKTSIWGGMIKERIAPMVLSLVAVMLGVLFIMYSLFNHYSGDKDNSLMMMGIFSTDIGLWKISDIDAMSLLFPDSIAWACVPFLTLLLVVIPFVLYIQGLFVKKTKIWYVPCWASIIDIIGAITLQFAGIADLRQTLWMNHVVMGLVLVCGLIMLFREVYLVGWNSHLKITVICLASCLIGMVADVVVYYISKGASITIMGMLGFLVYIIVLGVRSLRKVSHLMSIGREAKHYKQIAYHDQLTGLYNRAAYADDIGDSNFKKDNCILMMCDLNNLKQCNDTFGHEKGDSYIRNSAKLIQEVLEGIGKCYRVGGDEFCILMKGVSEKKCLSLLEELKYRTEIWNQESEEEFYMQIACGYACYDAEQDYDLGDTLRRADRMMYQEKFVIKQQERKIQLDS